MPDLATDFWMPQEGPQVEAYTCPADEIFYGGAKGGGKSDCVIGRQIKGAIAHGYKWKGFICRRKYKDLGEMRKRFDEIIRIKELPAERTGGETQINYVRFKNGATIILAAISFLDMVDDWWGHQFTEVSIDEGPTFPFIAPMMDKLKGSLRSPHGIPCQMFITGNPGGPGSAQIKTMFIPPELGGECPSPEGVPYEVEVEGNNDSISKISRVFIKSELKDNVYLYGTDSVSAYANRLLTIQDKALRAAWIDGRWDVFIGQAFDFGPANIIEPIWPIPEYAPLFMTFDYGFGAPYSVQWWWVDGDNRLYLFSELYGCQKGMPNVGIRKTDQDIALAILEQEEKLGILGRPIKRLGGGDCFRKKPDYKGGGQGSATSDAFKAFMNNPSAVERWGKTTSLKMTPGDDRRETKIRQFRNRLARPTAGELPMLVVYNTCKTFIRIIPTLCMNEVAGEDLEDGQEDHAYDSACHVCQHMPIGVTDEEISGMLQKTKEAEKMKGLDNVSRAAAEDYRMTLKQILEEQEAVTWFNA